MAATSAGPHDPPSPAPLGRFGTFCALLILGAAAALRFWHLGAGIPYNVGVDEPQIMNRVYGMMTTGDLNPRFFDWPSLTFYLQLVVACVTFLIGAMLGLWSNLTQIGPGDLYLTGRGLTALLGTGTVALTLAAGRRWGTSTALVSAALMAVISNHVRESHYVLTDIPAAFFTTLTLLLSLRAYEQPSRGRLLWAAVAAGLAGSCKYNGLMVLIMPVTVAWATGTTSASRVQRTLMVVGAAFGAFLLGTPYAILDLPKFLNDYARLAAVFAHERVGDPGWLIYTKHLSMGMGSPALLLAAGGVLIVLGRLIIGPGRVPAFMLLSFAGLYFAVMAGSYQIYGRYMLPLYPVLSLLGALALASVLGKLRGLSWPRPSRQLTTVALIASILAMPAASSVSFDRQHGRRSTHDLMLRWILQNVQPGAKFAVEAGSLQLPVRYPTIQVAMLPERSYEDYRNEGVNYLLAGSAEFQQILANAAGSSETDVAYRKVLGPARQIAGFDATAEVPGPSLRLFEVLR